MSLLKSLKDAYKKKEERNWDSIYWSIDLHGVCLKSNYRTGGYEWINDKAEEAMRLISARKDAVIILWSSVFETENDRLKDFFFEHGVWVDAINENPYEENTETGCFDKKFYFSMLLDDKAGFDPDEDWDLIIEFLKGKIE